MNKDLPILYSFRRCPYAMRARWALYVEKMSHVHREVDLKNKPPELLTLSPKGTVPVLQCEDGRVIEQSVEIMSFAMKQSFVSSEDKDLITENDTTFKKALDRYKYPGRYPEKTDADDRAQCAFFLKKLEQRLHPFLNGKDMTFVDIAIFPFIRQCVGVDPTWFETQPYPRLKEWLDCFIKSTLFNDVMASYSPWIPSQDPVLIIF